MYDQRTTGCDFLTGEKVEELFGGDGAGALNPAGAGGKGGDVEGGRLADDAAERERLANLRWVFLGRGRKIHQIREAIGGGGEEISNDKIREVRLVARTGAIFIHSYPTIFIHPSSPTHLHPPIFIHPSSSTHLHPPIFTHPSASTHLHPPICIHPSASTRLHPPVFRYVKFDWWHGQAQVPIFLQKFVPPSRGGA